MRDLLPLFLYEATLSLYPVAADDRPLIDSPLWWGAPANGLRLTREFDELLMMSSGAARYTAHHLDERHTLDIERTWVLRKTAPSADFLPRRNQHYALEIVWESNGYWYRRTYFGVTGRSVGWDSVRTLQFGSRQSYRAEYFREEGGYVPPADPQGSSIPPPPIYTPLPAPENDDEQSIGFFRENALVQGEYLLGHYRWPVDAQLVSAKAVAFAPQTSPIVLALEVSGALVPGKTISLPVGMANTEVSTTASLIYNIAAGQSVRWKIVSAPSPEESAYVCALVMQLQPL